MLLGTNATSLAVSLSGHLMLRSSGFTATGLLVDGSSDDVSFIAGVVVCIVICVVAVVFCVVSVVDSVVFAVVRVRRLRVVRDVGTWMVLSLVGTISEGVVCVLAIVATSVVDDVWGVVKTVVVGANGVRTSSSDVMGGGNELDGGGVDTEPSTQFAFSGTSHGGFAAL